MAPQIESEDIIVVLREKIVRLEERIKFHDNIWERIIKLEATVDFSEKALVLAREQMDVWKLSTNEWRDENKDQRALYPTSDKVHALIEVESMERKALEDRVNIIEKGLDANAGSKNALSTIWAVATTVIAILIAIVTLILNWK